MSTYAERQARLRQRNLDRAEKLEREAEYRLTKNDELLDAMNGSPVLDGHHSENRHRRDLAKIDSDTRRGFEAQKAADGYRQRAASVEHTGVSVHDDDAAELLRARIAGLEKQRDEMKAINTSWRKCKGDTAKISNDSHRKIIEGWLAHKESYDKKPIEGWQLSNIGANIRRLRARVDEIAVTKNLPSGKLFVDVVGGIVYTVTAAVDDERVRVEFDARVPKPVCAVLRRNGYKWSPTRSAWVRSLTVNAVHALPQLQADLGRV